MNQIKEHLANFAFYLLRAAEFAKLGMLGQAEYFLVSADVAREGVYRRDPKFPELDNMAKEISKNRRNLLSNKR